MSNTVRVYSSCTNTIHEGSASAAVSEFAAGVAADDYASGSAVCGGYVVTVVSEVLLMQQCARMLLYLGPACDAAACKNCSTVCESAADAAMCV
jgi:hypothetical protein